GKLLALGRRQTYLVLLDRHIRIVLSWAQQSYENICSYTTFRCYKILGSPVQNEPIFLSRLGTIYSREWVNMRLKEYKVKYRLSIKSYSSHSHRKTFGRHIVERAGADAEKALIKLSEIFSHSSCEITRRYLGLKAEEIGEVYESLDF
ncbi:MAG: site-specific integrase, partial [Alistipes sp.]|nr:site-specific integrase [Alistipes sp.]